MRELPGPLGLKAAAIAVLLALLNTPAMQAGFPGVHVAVLFVCTAVGSYAWVFTLRTIARAVLGGLRRVPQ